MLEERRALTAERGIVRADTSLAAAEERLRLAVRAVSALDAEIETLASELAAFSRSYEAALGDRQRDLHGAEDALRRIAALAEALDELATRIALGAVKRPGRRRKVQKGGRSRPQAPPVALPAIVPAEEPAASSVLKRLYRRLARMLHPDLARDEEEASRLGQLMAGVNAAYASGDLAALEILAQRHGAGDPPPEWTPAERLAQLEHRALTLERIASSLARERDRLVRSDAHRLLLESRRCEAEGRDFVRGSLEAIDEELALIRAEILIRLHRLDRAAVALSGARSKHMSDIVKLGPVAARRAFDPLKESAVVRAGASRLDRARATAEARKLALWMEDAEPWKVALTLLAFFAEEAGPRSPASLGGTSAWARTWESLGPDLSGAPDLVAALVVLPDHLVVGGRLQGSSVVAGVQLASAELSAGVRLALGRERVAVLARRVLAALGPVESCSGCGFRGPALHRLRTRGLDEHHGVGCASCGAIVRSYWRYGELEGIEALAPYALSLGLVGEITVDLADTSVGFQMSQDERQAFTAAALRRAFAELYLTPYEVELSAGDIQVIGPGGLLQPRARVGDIPELRLAVTSKDLPAEELLEILRARIERRFRP